MCNVYVNVKNAHFLLFKIKIQEVWKVSTTAGTKRGKKNAPGSEVTGSGNSLKENEPPAKLSATTATFGQSSAHADASQVNLQHLGRLHFNFSRAQYLNFINQMVIWVRISWLYDSLSCFYILHGTSCM